jgi:integrase
MRGLNRLKAKQVETLKLEPGQKSRMVCDGGGLWLLIRRGEGDQIIRSWVFRYATPTPQTKTSKSGKSYRAERSMGLGSTTEIDLAGERPALNSDKTQMVDRDGKPVMLLGARTLAAQYRVLLAQGIDPIEARDTSKRVAAAKQTNAMTFADSADGYVKAHQSEWKNADHRAQWERTLRTQINPVLGSMNVADVDTQAVLRVLQPIWSRTPETASRIRGRIETVLDYAKVKCGFAWLDGANPARWRGHLDKMFPKRNKAVDVENLPSLHYKNIGAFMEDLRAKTGIAARALEMVILCGTRSAETYKATWHGIDWEKRVWTISKRDRKNKRPLVIPLSDAAMSVLHPLYELRQGDRIFPGISKDSMKALLRSMRKADGSPWVDEDGKLATVHGFRSTFRTWAGEETNYPRELCELAVGHRVGDATEQAYSRGDGLPKRIEMMQRWADYCARLPGDNVVKLVSAAA